MKMVRNLLLFASAIWLTATTSNAAFIFDIGDVVTFQGTTAVEVPIIVTTPVGLVTQFGGFALAVDVAPAGNQLPAGVSYNATPISNSAIFNAPFVNSGFNAVFNIDGIANGGTPTGALLTAGVPTTVATLRFDVGAGVAPGVYTINFIGSAVDSVSDSAANVMTRVAGVPLAANQYSVVAGSITVVAVPEPSSMLLAGGVAAIAGLRTWRKRRLASKA